MDGRSHSATLIFAYCQQVFQVTGLNQNKWRHFTGICLMLFAHKLTFMDKLSDCLFIYSHVTFNYMFISCLGGVCLEQRVFIH